MYIKKGYNYKHYALYKGDEFIVEGTLKEISEKTKLAITTLRFYKSKAYKERCHVGNNKVLIVIE